MGKYLWLRQSVIPIPINVAWHTLPFKPQQCPIGVWDIAVEHRTDFQAGTQISIFMPPTNMTAYCSTRPGSDRFSSRKGLVVLCGLLASASCGESVGSVCFSSIAVCVTATAELRAVCPLSGLFSLQTLCRQQSVIRVKGWSAVEALCRAGKFGRRRGFWHLFRKLSSYLAQSDKRLSVVLHPK